MEYPGTKFTRPIRLALLFTLIGIFLIVSPLLIMYTAGYRYDWKEGLLKETGSINIDIRPATATVYLNNVKLNDQIPVRLNNIVPARYLVRISQDGYFDWNKEIEVKNKQTNYIKEISLLRKSKPEQVVAGTIDDFRISYDGRFIVYAIQKNSLTQIWLRDITNKVSTKLLELNPDIKTEFSWAEKNNYLAIGIKDESMVYIINATNPKDFEDLGGVEKFQWGNTTEPQLYYSNNDKNIFAYSPENQNTQIVTKNNYLDWQMDNDQLWTITENTTTQEYIITKDTLGFSSLIKKLRASDLRTNPQNGVVPINLHIIAAHQNTALLKTDTEPGMVLVHNDQVYKLAVNSFVVSPYNNWWLLWSDLELWGFQENAEPYLINRSGENLKQVVPLDQYNTLALVWANKTTALFPYYSVTHELVNERTTQVNADTSHKILYYIHGSESKEKNNDGIWKINY